MRADIYFCLLLEIKENINPKHKAVQIPAAVFDKPPFRAPIKPSLSTASLTPVTSEYPKPVNGTVAPVEANSTSGL